MDGLVIAVSCTIQPAIYSQNSGMHCANNQKVIQSKKWKNKHKSLPFEISVHVVLWYIIVKYPVVLVDF